MGNPIDKIKVNIEDVMLPGIPRINIKFANNGEVTIPGEYGGYVVASGCGSGKTTAIKEIISKCYNRGIVYAAFTIEECNEMYRYCCSIMDKDDIALLHSDYKCEGVNTSLLNRLDELSNKKVIICTHYKLLNEYPEIFQKYSGNKISNKRFSKIKRESMEGFDKDGIKRFPRQLIIVDEMPTCKSTTFTVSKNTLRLLGVPKMETRVDEQGHEYVVPADNSYPIKFSNGGNFEIAEELLKVNSKSRPLLFGNSTESEKLKNTLALSIIYDNYDLLMESNKEEFTLTYTLADHISKDLSMRIIIFDGTGDLTFRNSSVFKVLSFPEKYSSPINVMKFNLPDGFIRRYKTEKELAESASTILNDISTISDNLSDIIKSNNRTLVITWKNLKVLDTPKSIPIINGDDIEYISYLKSKLNEHGLIEGNDYSIIHYQSGLDKATNEFRDYDSIVFLGEFHVPGYVVDKFNQDYRVKTDISSYTMYQLVQAICRTRIRLHQGLPINVYFTNDWRDGDINGLIEYIKSSSNNAQVRNTTLNNIKPKWRNVARILSDIDDKFRLCIETNNKKEIDSRIIYKVEFSLDMIYELIPMSEKKIRSYYPMINYFRKLGIDITIKSEYKKFTSEDNPMIK